MIIGIPKEIKKCEYRVGITPIGVKTLVNAEHTVLVQKSAGVNSGFSDEEYIRSGAQIIDSAGEIYEKSDIIVKVKEPQPSEYSMLKKHQILFSYLHLAVEGDLTDVLLDKRITAIAFETVEKDDGQLPLLIPMSEIAGKMSVQIAASLLEKNKNGKGILLGGITGVPRGRILILGAGHVGINAAKIAIGLGAEVCVVDTNIDKLRYLEERFGSSVHTYPSTRDNLEELIKHADVVIGAILVPGAKVPCIVTENMVKSMEEGSVIIDLSIDQGGIVETIDRVTTLDNPTYIHHGVIHYSVDNIPSAAPRTSTIALANETIYYLELIARKGIVDAIKRDSSIARGINTYDGRLTNEAVANSLDLEFTQLTELVGF